MKQEFPYIVKPVNEQEMGVKWVVEYLDFPGITGGGDTPEEAIGIANEALQMYQEVLEKEGKPLPLPTNLNATGRITLRIPKTLHVRAIEMADREGVSLNTYISDALSKSVYGYNAFTDWMEKLREFSNGPVVTKHITSGVKFDTPIIGIKSPFSDMSFGLDQYEGNTIECKEVKPYAYQH